RPVRTDRPEGRLLGRRLGHRAARAGAGGEAGPRVLAALPPLRRPDHVPVGAGQRGGAAGGARRHRAAVGGRDAGVEPHRVALRQARVQRRHRPSRRGRVAVVRRAGPVHRFRGGDRGGQLVRPEAAAGVPEVPAVSGGPAAGEGPARERLAERWSAWQASLPPAEQPPAGTETLSRIPLRPVYTPLDAPEAGDPDGYLARIGLPGEPPYTRGIHPLMYRGGPWVMGMYSGHASPQETNRRIRSLLASGQRGFSVALDLPTQNGLDSDHPLAAGEVGRVGVPLDSLVDMCELLDGIDLRQVRQIRTTANAIGPIAVAMFVAAAEAHGYR